MVQNLKSHQVIFSLECPKNCTDEMPVKKLIYELRFSKNIFLLITGIKEVKNSFYLHT